MNKTILAIALSLQFKTAIEQLLTKCQDIDLLASFSWLDDAQIAAAIDEGKFDGGICCSSSYDEYRLRTNRHLFYHHSPESTCILPVCSQTLLIGKESDEKQRNPICTDLPQIAKKKYLNSTIVEAERAEVLSLVASGRCPYGITIATDEQVGKLGLHILRRVRNNCPRLYFSQKWLNNGEVGSARGKMLKLVQLLEIKPGPYTSYRPVSISEAGGH